MSICTNGYLKGFIPPEEILKLIKKIDQNAIMDIQTSSFGKISKFDFIKEKYDNSGEWKTTSGFIIFSYKADEMTSIFYCYENINGYQNIEYFKKHNLEKMVKAEKTWLSLCYDETYSIQVMDMIVSHFGGWMDEIDIDDVPYRWVSIKKYLPNENEEEL